MKIIPSWCRIHLSTAIVLMIAASWMLGMNSVRRDNDGLDLTRLPPTGFYGWTRVYLERVDDPLYIETNEWRVGDLVLDAFIAGTLLVVIAVVLEKRIAILQRMKKLDH